MTSGTFAFFAYLSIIVAAAANSVLSLNGEEPDQKAKETKKSEAESEEQAISEE